MTISHGMPIERSKFVGRERELRSLRDMLARRPLLTIVGPPGVGKTRLALHFANLCATTFADGASFLDLAGAKTGDSLPLLIGEQLGLELRDKALESLLVALAPRQALLVFDNCEQVIDEAARICAAMLLHCPDLRIIATSREPLRVDGEAIWQLAPFEAPETESSLSALKHNDCVALFVDRAAARQPGFALSDENKADISSICRQLDGVPLAIELAATLVDSLSLKEIAAGLGEPLPLLVRGQRTVERQRSLRASILWSYSLLDEGEQRLLRRVSIVPGEFDIPTAAALSAADDAILATVLELTEKSLFIAVPGDGAIRYRLLEPIRQFAFEMLAGTDDEDSTRSHHLAHFMSRAEALEPVLMSGQREPALKSVALDLHHIRAALEWGLGHNDTTERERAARLIAALMWFWPVSGSLTEGMRWLEKAAQVKPPLSLETRARVLYAGGELAWLLGEESLGRAWLGESLPIWRQLGDQRRVAYCLQALSFLVEPEHGREQAAESIEIFEAIGDEWGCALAVHTLGMIDSQAGNGQEGRAKLEEGARRYEKLGDTYLLVQALNLLGDLDRNERHYAQARTHYEAALTVLQGTTYRGSAASIIQNLGFVAFHLDQLGEARDRFREAIRLFVNQGDRRGVAESLLGLSAVLSGQGALEQAAILFGASGRILVEANATLWRSNREDAERTAQALRSGMGESQLNDAVSHGESLTLTEAVSMALNRESGPARRLKDTRAAPLSRRELDVALLVARGFRNRQIAEELVISEATARLHVKNILRRLGFHSRSEVATWVSSRGLLASNRID